MQEVFSGSFTQQEPIPEAGIAAAIDVMRHGRLHRYNTAPGETAQTVLLEQEFAQSVGARYCLAVASGGYALATALRALGVTGGDTVLTNVFTLAPVPGAIAAVGAVPVFVGVTDELVLDFDDLEAKAQQARVLLLSHMRGHICDMNRLTEICEKHGITIIEDCAHTMGAAWDEKPSGRWGKVGCFSCQTYKHMNSGEGGLLVTDDPEVAARAILYSGSYMLYEQHLAGPPKEAFDDLIYETPNISGRMDNLRAAILRPQLATLAKQCARWNVRYAALEAGLRDVPGLKVIERSEKEHFVGSSFQFLLPGWSAEKISQAVECCARRGVALKWFGASDPSGYTSRYDSWAYAAPDPLPASDRVLAGLVDLRVPLTITPSEFSVIARIIREEVGRLYQTET
ncbi:aminotransferase class I/II-fold pyridoxal phosphate-dependent enzyme [uncultured Sulfitobacter sp.]|uniref:DegT/DnrJ/EryC1/StrS family aminotransferase n=1 Tax=uncultured Sulfitobacter sp. TaxID=191468 RepID=UPI00262C337B|nr:aminotransferase class I/II-fold pyridoxal phosphate-dependent enzyme [uncultured Sulfitobacter sp.]